MLRDHFLHLFSSQIGHVTRTVCELQLPTSNYFLGSEDITDSVDWVRDNRGGWILVETGSGKGGRPPRKAEVLIVGKISGDQFYLTPEGGWSPRFGAMYDRTFCQSKAKARIVRPDDDVYASVWDETVENAAHLMRSTLTRPLGNALVNLDTDGGFYMPVRHSVFHKNCPDERLLMENWECTTSDAQNALRELIASNNNPNVSPKYLGRAIPVHTADGNLVLPHAYEAVLRGATAVIGFHILHQVIPEADLEAQCNTRVQPKDVPRIFKDHFFADITSITVLGPPPPEPVSQARERGFALPPYLQEGVSNGQPQKKTRRR
ncbi:hypothetical protein EWM64_g1669 [Hericium alpestre]|uniref:Uncharacterized protein n=1 Tax=Hericium alpestre TaxID=135208 RepID=A0A4Z0A5M6_9AGAM|nr:hypothetical protein EWM64_g1669 [Hericium alpestre]